MVRKVRITYNETHQNTFTSYTQTENMQQQTERVSENTALPAIHPNNILPLENEMLLISEENGIQPSVAEVLRDLQHKFQVTNERLDSLVRRIDSDVTNVIPTKPRILPFSTIEAIQMFTDNNAAYDEAVRYFKFLNCITLKNSVHKCIKEAIKAQVAGQLTWWGVKNIKFPFYNTVLCQAIYQAVASNRYYPKPTRKEFQREVAGGLNVMKQRNRVDRDRHLGTGGIRRNLQAVADALYNEDVGNHENDRIRSIENEHNNNNVEDMENDNSMSSEHSLNINDQ